MKRQPRKVRWTKTARMYAGKEMLVDGTLQLAARRNIPTRYSRELLAHTLQAMKRVSEIRARRERVFYKKRMAGKRLREVTENHKLVALNEHLLRDIEKHCEAAPDTERGVYTKELAIAHASQKGKAFGVGISRLRRRIDGDVEEVTEWI